MNNRQNNLGEVVLYKTEDGKTALDVRLEGDTVWLTQAQMAKLFNNTKQNISLHTRNIFRERELTEKAVIKESLTTAPDGKKYRTKYFNLDVIISVGYRVKSKRGIQFRIWATQTLKDHTGATGSVAPRAATGFTCYPRVSVDSFSSSVTSITILLYSASSCRRTGRPQNRRPTGIRPLQCDVHPLVPAPQ